MQHFVIQRKEYGKFIKFQIFFFTLITLYQRYSLARAVHEKECPKGTVWFGRAVEFSKDIFSKKKISESLWRILTSLKAC